MTDLSLPEFLDAAIERPSTTELRLLRLLVRAGPGRWWSTQHIVEAVWGEQITDPEQLAFELANLRTVVWRLRRKLADSGWRIDNSPGFYRLRRAEDAVQHTEAA